MFKKIAGIVTVSVMSFMFSVAPANAAVITLTNTKECQSGNYLVSMTTKWNVNGTKVRIQWPASYTLWKKNSSGGWSLNDWATSMSAYYDYNNVTKQSGSYNPSDSGIIGFTDTTYYNRTGTLLLKLNVSGPGVTINNCTITDNVAAG